MTQVKCWYKQLLSNKFSKRSCRPENVIIYDTDRGTHAVYYPQTNAAKLN